MRVRGEYILMTSGFLGSKERILGRQQSHEQQAYKPLDGEFVQPGHVGQANVGLWEREWGGTREGDRVGRLRCGWDGGG
jgi:hypothetical protein